jgi:hypothetical protein
LRQTTTEKQNNVLPWPLVSSQRFGVSPLPEIKALQDRNPLAKSCRARTKNSEFAQKSKLSPANPLIFLKTPKQMFGKT